MTHLFPYSWRMADGYPAPGIKPNGLKVFGTFICGGGSSMGYKLAGYEHLGGVEIDEKVSAIYERNHHPKYLYTEDLRIFNQRDDLPDELYQLDLLDGSPPCSTFSMAGSREKAWGKEKIFAEGQALQTLDDLVFVYCETIIKLQPKVFLLENVKGLAVGNAKSYLRRIFDTLNRGGYDCQVFILNAASMGVPQIRERCFVIGRRKDLDLTPLKLSFNEPPIVFGEIIDRSDTKRTIPESDMDSFNRRNPNEADLYATRTRLYGKTTGFTIKWLQEDWVVKTLTTAEHYLTSIPRTMNETELLKVSTFPQDYQYPNIGRLRFLTGMSVPPVMTAQVAHQIAVQVFGKPS